jgi:hypothetical protein
MALRVRLALPYDVGSRLLSSAYIALCRGYDGARWVLSICCALCIGVMRMLTANMKACGLSKYNNYWSYIHDFTKAAGNFSYLPAVSP